MRAPMPERLIHRAELRISLNKRNREHYRGKKNQIISRCKTPKTSDIKPQPVCRSLERFSIFPSHSCVCHKKAGHDHEYVDCYFRQWQTYLGNAPNSTMGGKHPECGNSSKAIQVSNTISHFFATKELICRKKNNSLFH